VEECWFLVRKTYISVPLGLKSPLILSRNEHHADADTLASRREPKLLPLLSGYGFAQPRQD
jgi:hypothetical protein